MSVSGASSTFSSDVLLAKYTDNGTAAALAWVQVGGGSSTDQGNGLALSGASLLIGAIATPAATFGNTVISSPVNALMGVLVRLTDPALAPLPVQLVQFVAVAQGLAAAQLTWATASELNSAAFEVQRSPDGRTWATLGTVAAAGNSATPRHYSYLDAQAPAGTSYYRLRQLDQDGTAAYSPVQAVRLGGTGLALYPNPATGAATLAGAAPGQLVRVLDALGRVAATAPADAAGTARLAGLAPGLYVVQAGAATLRLAVE